MIAVHVVAGMAWRIPQVASMDGALTAEDVRLLSAWALGVEGDSSEDLQLLLAVPGEELQLQGASEAPKRKKQRSTYLRTREAKAGLKDEIAALEARLEALKGRAGLGSGDRANVQQTAVQNAVLRGVAHQQHMKMAGTHSALVARLNMQATHPLYTPVHLGKDWQSRSETLVAMKDTKLRAVSQYLMERAQGLDELLPHSSQDATQDKDGNMICSQFDVLQFENVHSLREMFDEAIDIFAHEEIVLSERLGLLAICDSFDVFDRVATNSHVYLIDNNGVTTEWNSVKFAHLFDENHAVLACDNVDVDARYPFRPDSRVRRDFSGGITLSVVEKAEDDSLIVVMRRAAIIKIHRPRFPLTEEAKESLVKSAFQWSEAMLSSIKSKVNSSSSARTTLSAVM